MEAQRKRARDMALPKIKEKVKEYYYKYRFLQEIIDRTGINNKSKILDVGCGIKTVLHFLPGSLKVGIDPLAKDYKKIYNYPPDLIIRKSYGEKIPYGDGYFDVVFITNALDHTKNPQEVILETRRVLKRNGYLVITNELVEKDCRRNRAHPHNLIEADILALLENGFRIIFKKYSPWFGIRQYYLGEVDLTRPDKRQIIILAEKL